MGSRRKVLIFAAAVFFPCQAVLAGPIISEVMYDLPGSDSGREWVEIANTGGSDFVLATSSWKFFENNTNHSLALFQGSLTIPGGGFAIIADDPQKFLIDWPGFSGTIFDSVFSLSNTGEMIALKSATTTIADQVTYASTTGASGDGNSLQKVGNEWKSLKPTPGLANSPNQQVSADNSGTEASSSAAADSNVGNIDAQSDSSSQTAVSASDAGRTSWPVEPQMFSRIVGPASAISGADIVFKGEAVGLEKKPLDNPRFLWNFGDGGVKEGESVMHAYNYHGDYVVVLNASSGKYSAVSRLKVSVVPADIAISEVVPGEDGKIELENKSKYELDLSWWRIESNGQFFTIPENTILLPRGKLAFASRVISLNPALNATALLYPNGFIATRFENRNLTASTTRAPLATAGENKVLSVADKPLKQIVLSKATAAEPTKNLLKVVPKTVGLAAALAAFPKKDGLDENLFSNNAGSSTVLKERTVEGGTPVSRWYWWATPLGAIALLSVPVLWARKPEETADDDITIIE